MLPCGIHGGIMGVAQRFGLIKLSAPTGVNNFADTSLSRRMLHLGSPPQKCTRSLALMSSVPVRPTRRVIISTYHLGDAERAFRPLAEVHGRVIAQRRGFGWLLRALRRTWVFRAMSAQQPDHSGTLRKEHEVDEAELSPQTPTRQMPSSHIPSSHILSDHTPSHHAPSDHTLSEHTASDHMASDRTASEQTVSYQTPSHHTPIQSGPARPTDSHQIEGDPKLGSLTEEQRSVLDLVLRERKSVFFTGPAGTGKSFLLRKIIKSVTMKHLANPEEVAVTASTGIAATNIGGRTLHSFAGIGLGKASVEELIMKIHRNRKQKDKWTDVEVLIIDEISMIDGHLFDKLERIAREIRQSELPFGGIQLVVAGDFFQLPPVARANDAKFAFEAEAWDRTIEHTIGLTHIFRQKEPILTSMLNETREGRLSSESIQRFKSLSRPLHLKDGLEPSKLFALRSEVDRANHLKLDQLPGDVRTYTSQDWGSTNERIRELLLSGCNTPRDLRFKKGAQVMLTKNLSPKLVNGSLGQIVDFVEEPGSKIQYPLVRFMCIDGTTDEVLCVPAKWIIQEPITRRRNETTKNLPLAGRIQVPLILAWALSIHKAQGQSLDFVKVDLAQVFEKGQAYVALSRATSMKGLQVLNFDPGKVLAHEKVRAFYETLSAVDTKKAMLQRERCEEIWRD